MKRKEAEVKHEDEYDDDDDDELVGRQSAFS